MVRSRVLLIALAAFATVPAARAAADGGSSQGYLDQILKGTPAQRSREKAIRDEDAAQRARLTEGSSVNPRTKHHTPNFGD